VPYVIALNSLLAEGAPQLKNVGCLYGRKGTGKSLLASTLTIVNHLNGNVKSIYYYRYNSNTKKFDRIFESEGEKGNQIVIIADDAHYFSYDFAKDILNGSFTSLDRSIGVMMQINKLMNPSRSLLVIHI
jgi:hypothetical protein